MRQGELKLFKTSFIFLTCSWHLSGFHSNDEITWGTLGQFFFAHFLLNSKMGSIVNLVRGNLNCFCTNSCHIQ